MHHSNFLKEEKMKAALLKIIVLAGLVLVMSGCEHLGTITGAGIGAGIDNRHPVRGAVVGGVVGAIADDQYNPYRRGGAVVGRGGYYGQGRVVRGGGVYTHPCQPYRADGLMAWATELDGSQHTRDARVSNNEGRVQCSSSESASSRTSSRGQ